MNAYFTLRKLTGPSGNDVSTTFNRMAELLKGTEDEGKFQFQITTDDKPSYYVVEVNKKTSLVKTVKNDKPDFEIITDADTWWQIADGALSPLRAFLEHKIRVRGNLPLGKKILMSLSSPKTK
jgi:putative sterol carrier protein